MLGPVSLCGLLCSLLTSAILYKRTVNYGLGRPSFNLLVGARSVAESGKMEYTAVTMSIW